MTVGGQQILVMDDDKDFLDSTKVILESRGFEVATATRGEECLKKLETFKPDLLILDIMMPEKSGFEVCKELKGSLEYKGIPVIMLTALDQKLSETNHSLFEGLQLEAEDYITKPVDPEELVFRIDRQLEW